MILLTAFDPFGDLTENASQQVLEALPDAPDLTPLLLPTAFEAAAQAIRAHLDEHKPRAVINLGVAQSSPAIRLERVALNLDDARIPDNHGAQPRGLHIMPDAPPAYWTTLPLEAMLSALQVAGIPATLSNHAGAFVCNHVFFCVQHHLATTAPHTPAGFIHLPGVSDEWPLAILVAGVSQCLDVLRAPV